MPRHARSIVGGYVYHVLNRANGRLRLFKNDADFADFEQLVAEAHERIPLRILGYALLKNHWQFVVWPQRGKPEQVSDFFRWLAVTHAARWNARRRKSEYGSVYRDRFKSFPIATDEHLPSVLRFVESSPLEAGLVNAAEKWRWGSLYRRMRGTAEKLALLTDSPVPLGRAWTQRVNRPLPEAELEAILRSVQRGQPYGSDAWRNKIAREHGLEHTLRPRGRPRIHFDRETPVPA